MEWQTIDTAPKDGTEVLACAIKYPDEISIVAFRRYEVSYGRYAADWVGMCDGVPAIKDEGDTYTNYHLPFVTHWMPLPEPPKGE